MFSRKMATHSFAAFVFALGTFANQMPARAADGVFLQPWLCESSGSGNVGFVNKRNHMVLNVGLGEGDRGGVLLNGLRVVPDTISFLVELPPRIGPRHVQFSIDGTTTSGDSFHVAPSEIGSFDTERETAKVIFRFKKHKDNPNPTQLEAGTPIDLLKISVRFVALPTLASTAKILITDVEVDRRAVRTTITSSAGCVD